MKKVIALAVAGAFVAPVYAAEISVSGEVETTFTSGDSANTTGASSEFTISASDEFANGISVSAYVHQDGNAIETTENDDDDDVLGDGTENFNDFLSISAPFGSVSMGSDGDTALVAYDDKADVASAGGGEADAATGGGGTPILVEPNLGIDGVTLGIGYRSGGSGNDEMTDFALAYEAMGLELTYGQADLESSDETITNTSLAYSFGPIYVGFDSVENAAGAAGDDREGVGITYDIGATTAFYEQNEFGADDSEETSFGVEYQIGAGLEVYAANIDADDEADDETVIGAEYKF